MTPPETLFILTPILIIGILSIEFIGGRRSNRSKPKAEHADQHVFEETFSRLRRDTEARRADIQHSFEDQHKRTPYLIKAHPSRTRVIQPKTAAVIQKEDETDGTYPAEREHDA
ncbi:hypothetical protein ASF99_04880 [Exiguobacterium sp. Leaf187]|uniref:hypothetical protein n=1 Tax=Exiguobacterium sp. Leaf187 TaxID=1736294 RepID=UPI0006FAFAE7|nr:hypothetical protein [Exiguobacterium sp. Leaf187]KQS19223.1 hypothetical protein ASF99_04880 [Exiguobacterium sp. Leaf187]